MKIAILSDFHLGYAYGTELESDSFDNADEAMEQALNADLILIPGDIFDSRVPKTSVWARAIKILVKPLLQKQGAKFVECSKELNRVSKRTLQHLPVVALHGTHERRYETNAIEALEHAGLLVHLHCETIVFEKDGMRVAVHGMSGVPDRYAKNELSKWNPKLMRDCVNILMMHQSIEPYVYSPLEQLSLNLSNLPKGFDLIIDGHLHAHGEERVDSSLLLMPGSTIVTQLEMNEAEAEKGFYEIDIDENKNIKASFRPLELNRKFFFEEIKVQGSARGQIERRLNEILGKGFAKKPLIKIKIVGKEMEVIEQEFKEIERKYADRAVIRFTKELESPELAEKIEFLRNLREQKLSVEEIGVSLLKKNLDELKFSSSFDHEHLFSLLLERDMDKAFNILVGEQKTLKEWKGDK